MSLAGFAELDVNATVAQMDSAVSQLRAAWNDRWATPTTVWLLDASAVNARMMSLKGLIDLLDVGGEARQHVFFPLPGQSQEEAWRAWQDTAEYVRTGLNEVGATIGRWTFTSIAARAGGDVRETFSSVGSWMLWIVGGVLAIQVVGLLRGGGRRRGYYSGYSRQRRMRR